MLYRNIKQSNKGRAAQAGREGGDSNFNKVVRAGDTWGNIWGTAWSKGERKL